DVSHPNIPSGLGFGGQVNLDFDDFLIQLEQEWSAFERVTLRTFKMGDKWVEVQKNHLYDPDLASNPANDYIHYRYRITVDPENDAQLASEGSPDLTQWIYICQVVEVAFRRNGVSSRNCC
ncbi:MAG TPA: hypothetical protein PKD09_22660, partial [Aggregatilinea sp.]|uniref:hypothetical protein n=1 Tax=Aggregatilinea sp. TaxID=2806333 RepID=UPI002B875642